MKPCGMERSPVRQLFHCRHVPEQASKSGDAGFLRHSMDFGATEFYLKEGYRFASEVLDSRRKRRRSPELAPIAAPVYR